MKKLLAGVAAAGLLTAVPLPAIPFLTGPEVAQAQNVNVSLSVFFDRLSAHGRWVVHPRHRYVWVPVDVEPDWVPYSHGRWVHTEQYGWYFVSDEPFAWAVYHYGRWAYDPGIGWYWVPGTHWAPAWVSWRRGGDFIGWAPLPPEGDGFVVSLEIGNPEPPPGYWVYVPVRRFAAPRLEVVIVARQEVPEIHRRTELVGPVVIQNNIVINNVIDIDFIQQNVEEEVTVTEVRVVDDPAAAEEAGGELVAFQGELQASEDAAPAEAVEPERVEAPTEGQEIPDADGADEASEAERQAPEEGEAPAEGTAPPAEEAPEGEERPADEAPAEEGQPAEESAPPAEEAPEGEQRPADEAPAEEGQPAEEPAPPAEEAPEGEQRPAEEAAPADEGEAEDCPEADRAAGRC